MERILIVDDEKTIRSLIKMTLSLGKYEYGEACDGKAALEKLHSEHFDLVLLDIMLPEMDGFELMSRIKDDGVPVIFLSAKDDVNEMV